MIEGNFIVLEGVDGAGTTTHTRWLVRALRSKGLPVYPTYEPSRGPVGSLLRQILTGRIVVHGVHSPRPPSWSSMALLFAADRMDHLEAEIIPNLMDGVTVVCDRYYYSSLAYQSLSGGGSREVRDWVKQLNLRARRPDLTLILDIPPDVAAERRKNRMVAQEMYDDDELQQNLTQFYRQMADYFPEDTIQYVDSNRTTDEVAADILERVSMLRGER